MLVGGEPPERLRDPALAVPAHPAVELGHEVPQRPAPPVPAVEELALEQPEEALGAGVVAAAPLARHAARQPVQPAYPGPAPAAVVAAAVGVDHRRLAGAQRGARELERRVDQRRVGPGRDRPGHGPAVQAVDDRAQVALGPDGRRNSVMSVTHSSLGRAARKRWVPSGSSGRLGGAGEVSPS